MPTAPPPRTSRMRAPWREELAIPLHRASFAAEYRDARLRAFPARAQRRPHPQSRRALQPRDQVRRRAAIRTPPRRLPLRHRALRAPRRHGPTAPELRKARDGAKDQSYFLHAVARTELACTLMPLGELEKGAVRERARRAGLPVFDKPDSTGICFIGERPFREFLGRFLARSPGTDRSRPTASARHARGARVLHTRPARRAADRRARRALARSRGTSPPRTARATHSSWCRDTTIRCSPARRSPRGPCTGSRRPRAEAFRCTVEGALPPERPGGVARAAGRRHACVSCSNSRNARSRPGSTRSPTRASAASAGP